MNLTTSHCPVVVTYKLRLVVFGRCFTANGCGDGDKFWTRMYNYAANPGPECSGRVMSEDNYSTAEKHIPQETQNRFVLLVPRLS